MLHSPPNIQLSLTILYFTWPNTPGKPFIGPTFCVQKRNPPNLKVEEIPNERTVWMNGRPLLRTKNALILASRVRYSGQRNTLILASRKSVHSLGHTNTLILASHKRVRY